MGSRTDLDGDGNEHSKDRIPIKPHLISFTILYFTLHLKSLQRRGIKLTIDR